jgi:16S rRNA (cytosine1402-N4)-methyltransferase
LTQVLKPAQCFFMTKVDNHHDLYSQDCSHSLHIPIMLKEILDFAKPLLSNGGRYFDGTFGRGGHLRSILSQYPLVTAVAYDRDLEAVEYGEKHFQSFIKEDRLTITHRNYGSFDIQSEGLFDFMLIDLGVSSPQLDQGERGFSFYHEGPLDMRMDLTQNFKASDILNEYTEAELIRVFKELGEVRSPYRVVRAVLHDRQISPYSRTRDFAGLIERVDGWRKKGVHPATQYFLALRLEVNQELEETREGLRSLVAGLKPGGRLAVLTFHSLEDRIVKWMFKDEFKALGRPLFKKVIESSEEEMIKNPRSRSAKLRIFERSLHEVDKSSGFTEVTGFKRYSSP